MSKISVMPYSGRMAGAVISGNKWVHRQYFHHHATRVVIDLGEHETMEVFVVQNHRGGASVNMERGQELSDGNWADDDPTVRTGRIWPRGAQPKGDCRLWVEALPFLNLLLQTTCLDLNDVKQLSRDVFGTVFHSSGGDWGATRCSDESEPVFEVYPYHLGFTDRRNPTMTLLPVSDPYLEEIINAADEGKCKYRTLTAVDEGKGVRVLLKQAEALAYQSWQDADIYNTRRLQQELGSHTLAMTNKNKIIAAATVIGPILGFILGAILL